MMSTAPAGRDDPTRPSKARRAVQMTRTRPVVLTGRHRPHQVLLTAAAAFLGLAYLFGTPPPTPIESVMPVWLLRIWYGVLLVGGLSGLVSLLWRPAADDTGLYDLRPMKLERASLLLLSVAPAEHAVALVAFGRIQGLNSAAILVGWAVANLWRAAQVTRDLRLLYRAERE